MVRFRADGSQVQKTNEDFGSNSNSHYLSLFCSAIKKVIEYELLTKALESRSPSEFPPLEVGNSNL